MKKQQRIYPVEPWIVREIGFDPKNNYRNETTFSLSNGYIGTRGTLAESYPFTIDEGLEGNFINGFYDSDQVRYGEWNYGFPEWSQSLLNVPNMKKIGVSIEDELFDLFTGDIISYERKLDMKRGIVSRDIVWRSPSQKELQIHSEELVSLENKHLMFQLYEVTPLNFSGEINFHLKLDGKIQNHTRKTNPLVDYGPFGQRLQHKQVSFSDNLMYYQGTTKHSQLSLGCGCSIMFNQPALGEANVIEESCEATYTTQGKEQQTIRLTKALAYVTNQDLEKNDFKNFIQETLAEATELDYSFYAEKQAEHFQKFWDYAAIEIFGDEETEQGLRFNMFHVFQHAGRDGLRGMPAKGLSGEGYEGHYFWDTEIYMLPLFTYTNPEIAQKLLSYRYHTLPEARDRARILGHQKGALYPWRTINGQEASTYFPLGTAQYHINADIAYAFMHYYRITGDSDFLFAEGCEVLAETARVWADVGSFSEYRNNQYCICAVTGPDEYNAIVDNNFYTNLMAQQNLYDALEALKLMAVNRSEAYQQLIEKLGLTEEELANWKLIADNMYFPMDKEKGIYLQDDNYMLRKPLSEATIPEEKRHLLYENYHPLFVWRQRMSKQADAVLGLYLHGDKFTSDELVQNYDFYQKVTLHHSSLSTAIFGIIASQIGKLAESYAYFMDSARMDLDDYHHNFYAGIHAANMAGTWQFVVNGFGGVRLNAGKLTIAPVLPEQWQGYRFKLQYQKGVFEIERTKEQAKVTLIHSNQLQELTFNGVRISLKQGESYVQKI